MVETITERHWFFSSIYRFFFGVPEFYASLFDKIFVDELVYEDQWRIFMSTCQNDWKLTMSWAFPLLMSSIMMSFIPKTSIVLTLGTVLTCSMSILAGMLLLIRHSELVDSSATVAAQYLHGTRSAKYGFQHVALIYSLPKALCLWSIVLFVSHWIFVAARMVNISTAIGVFVVLFVLVLGVRQGTQESERATAYEPQSRCYWARLFARFSSDVAVSEKTAV